MADEAKTPGTEGFADKIYRDITGRDISEHGQFEMPPPDGAGEDPWAGEDLTPTPQPFLAGKEEYYDKIDLKEIPELDTYEELATQWNAVGDESTDLSKESWERERADAIEKEVEDLRDIAETSKDIPVVGDALGGAAEQAAGELAAEVERPPVDLSNMNEVYKEGVTPNPDFVAKARTYEHLDTYEELETQYKQSLWARDQELVKKYESQQREAVEDAVEDVGNAAADFVKDHPALGDVLQGANAAGDGETPFPINFFEDMPGVGDHVKDAKDVYQKEQNRVGADAGDGEIEMPPESARDAGPLNYLRDLSGPTEEDELEKEAPPVDKPEPDASSATERVEPPGSEAAPIVEGEASTLIGGGASPTGDPRDEAFSGEEEEGEGAPDAAATAPTAAEGVEIEMPLDPASVDAAHADAAGLDAAGLDVADDAAEDAPSLIPEDQLLNPYEEEPSSIPEDQLLNPYEDDPSSIPEDQLLNEDEPIVDP